MSVAPVLCGEETTPKYSHVLSVKTARWTVPITMVQGNSLSQELLVAVRQPVLTQAKILRQVTGTGPLLRCSAALTRTLRHGCDVIGQFIK